jgi:hypothetical protein
VLPLPPARCRATTRTPDQLALPPPACRVPALKTHAAARSLLPLFGISFRRARSRRAWERAGFARPVPSAPCDRSLACPRSAAPSLVPQSNRNAPSGQRGPRPAEQSPLPTTPKGEAASGRKRLVRASCSCSPSRLDQRASASKAKAREGRCSPDLLQLPLRPPPGSGCDCD